MSARLEVEERDQAGQLVASYIGSRGVGKRQARIDISVPQTRNSYSRAILGAFLPAGYPFSVTRDYLPYQICDSLQAFSSSIAGLLASRAVLEGVGVGDANASATAALLLSVLQDSMGRIATIFFAHRLGTSLEPECKMYRLAADIFNDAAMILDCLSPALPKLFRVILLSFSSVLRSLCGVAAGSAKASLSAHFATQGNLGEVNAKDSSQETIISLLGMLAGSLVVSRVSSTFATWACLIFLLSIHLGTNYLAVRAVSMRTLNRQRANIVFTTFVARWAAELPAPSHVKDCVLDPDEVSRLERIFEWDGVLRWNDKVVARCSIGVPLRVLLDSLGQANTTTASYVTTNVSIDDILSLFSSQLYLIWYDAKDGHFIIVLKAGATTQTQLKAWLHVITVLKKLSEDNLGASAHPERLLEILATTLRDVERYWTEILPLMVEKDWDVEHGALETRSGTRIHVGGVEGSASQERLIYR